MMNSDEHIRLAGVVRESIVDGPGIRFVVFCQGCPHHCEECHNEPTHDFLGGFDCEISKILEAIDENPLLDGVTFSGGEPACQPEGFLALAREVHNRGLDIIMYSGYTYEELMNMGKGNGALAELIDTVDILIDGRYDHTQRDLTLLFRGSKNQRVIDIKKTREEGRVVLAENF